VAINPPCAGAPTADRGAFKSGLETASRFGMNAAMSKPATKGSARRAAKATPVAAKASRQLRYIIVAFAIGLVALAGLTYSSLLGRNAAGAAGIGGPFSMIGQDGRIVTNAELDGRPYLVFFGYTHCPDFCPTALFDISAVFREMGADKKVAALFVTVDPARDTPEVMKDYLAHFDQRIIGLTGDAARTQAIAKAFKVYYKKVPGENGDYTMDHTGIVYLMDKSGRFISAFNLSRPPQQAAKELEQYL
jgi:protein SCO1/2